MAGTESFPGEGQADRTGPLPRQPFPRFIRTLAKRASRLVGLEHAARTLYNRFAVGGSTLVVPLFGSTYRFATPTFTIVEELTELSESGVMRAFFSSLRPGDTAWDVGASYGLYALPLSRRVGPGGVVCAFEPEPRSRKLLRRNLALNAIPNVTVYDCALGRGDTPALLYRSRSANSGAHSLIRRTDYRVSRRGIPIGVRSGDSLVSAGAAKAPAALKIDVEGGEASVLDGMPALLGTSVLRMLLVEVHPEVLARAGRNDPEIEATLRRYGFTDITKLERGRQYHLLARRAEA